VNNRKKIKALENKVIDLKNNLDHNNISDADYRSALRSALLDIEEILENHNSLFNLASSKDLKQTLNRVEEAFLTSAYADDINNRIDSILLLKQLKLLV
tara:strand:+ start:922 stop:1218 length:297 start_codon:yes stop_codon:yes gene_type:complete